MIAKIRVLVVDDSVVVRRLLSDALCDEPDCEVVGVAANGRIALAKIPQTNPDIVTLDVEMPEMDGLETLAAIRKAYPKLPVIMFSALTERAADATLRALALGATDYLTKPNAAKESGMRVVREQLLARIRCLVRGHAARNGLLDAAFPTAASPAAVPPPRARAAHSGRFDVLAIGASTGGPNALAALVAALRADLPVPVVITQHMPPIFTRSLAERMNAASALAVREAAGGEALTPGHVYIAPGDYHLEVRREGAQPRIWLHQAAPENSCRPAVDVMFRSVAAVYGANTLAVVLTGMGQDGLRGCERIREAGGHIVVQDEASSVVWGMPGSVAKAGLADAVLPMGAIAGEISRRIR